MTTNEKLRLIKAMSRIEHMAEEMKTLVSDIEEQYSIIYDTLKKDNIITDIDERYSMEGAFKVIKDGSLHEISFNGGSDQIIDTNGESFNLDEIEFV